MSSLSKTGAAIMNTYGNKEYDKAKTLRTCANLDESKFSKDTFNDQFKQRNQKEFINEANKIMRERMKNKGSTINSKSRLKNVILKDTNEICLKNYLIDLLKAKRTDINEKEKNITKALRDSETRLDDDYKEFVDFVEKTKSEQKLREANLARSKADLEQLEKQYKSTVDDNKKYNEDLEKTIKMIGLLKSYGAFVHKVLGIPFVFDCIPDLDSKEKKYDVVAKLILRNYNKMTSAGRPAILDNDSLLIRQFTEFEEKVIKILENKQVIDKEIKALSNSYQEELRELEVREKDFIEEMKRVMNEKNHIAIAINSLKMHKNSEVEQHLMYISELGMEIRGIRNKGKKKSIAECLNSMKETLETLGEKEKIVNKYIKEIQGLLNEDEQVKKCITTRIKLNKIDKQFSLNYGKEQKQLLIRQKAIERSQKVVIKGRKVPQDYPILKSKKKKVNLNDNNDDNELGMLNYSSDEN